MRLICPNCGAQYEVTDSLIPASGRDVQCSACGQTWFEQPGASVLAEESPDVDTVPELEPAPRPDPAPEPVPEPAPATARAAAPQPIVEDDTPATFADDPEELPPPPVIRAPLRTVSADIAEILREEAAREQAARAAEARVGVETQSEFPLDDPDTDPPPPPPEDSRAQLARLRADPPPGVPPAIAAAAAPLAAVSAGQSARRDLLPDIEEINSTLRSASERGPIAAEATAHRVQSDKRGFRFGFSMVLLVAAVLAMVYVYTPRIAVIVPPAEPYLTAYAEGVDDARLWLDLRLQELLGMMDGAEPEAATGG